MVQLGNFLLGATISAAPWSINWVAEHFGESSTPSEVMLHRSTDYTGAGRPIPCHSHNDYWRNVPLFSALEAGCVSVEADVWLFRDELYVGHTLSSLAANRTLKTLYIQPLLEILDSRNLLSSPDPSLGDSPRGVFDTDPLQTLVLLIDFKARGREVWPYLQVQLSPLRERGYLTHFNGTHVIERPLTVVATGKAPFDLVIANSTYRDIFFDAPLSHLGATSTPKDFWEDGADVVYEFLRSGMVGVDRSPGGQDSAARQLSNGETYDFTNSYYASVSYNKAVGFPVGFRISKKQQSLIRDQVRAAHERGLKARYWGAPSWPRFLRNYIWAALTEAGVDILNVDDLRSATKEGELWRSRLRERSG
ncbi:hypothetical protein VTO42DRAFT_6055 [Malbranchea cinnamomea]